MLDKQEFIGKPTRAETIEINNRIVHSSVDIDPEQLAEEIMNGKTFVPAYLNRKIKGLLRRKKECWTSQEIFCADFDNEIEIDNPDYPLSSDKKKIKVKKITLTLEQALEQFKDTAMFIYTSFSHKPEHPKFRVVFAFEEAITNPYDMDDTLKYYKKEFPNADKQCFERARMFYGGKELYVLGYDHRIPYIHNKIKNTNSKGDYDSTKVLVSPLNYHSHLYPNINLVELIRNKDIHKLREILGREKQSIGTYAETVNYIKHQDIGELLGLNSRDRCPFHPDYSPSASIFTNEFTKHYLFHCHSDNCNFGTGTIIKVIERLTKLNKVQTLKFLRDIYNIEFIQTEWQIEQLEMIDENIRYLMSGDLEFEYPKQYKINSRYIPDLIQFLTLSKDYVAPKHYTQEQEKLLFYASLEHFARFCGKTKSKKRLGDKLALFTFFSYISKLKESDIPEEMLKRAKLELVKSKGLNGNRTQNLISFYEIPPYTDEVLQFAEKQAEIYAENHFTMKGMSYEMIYRALGEAEAARVYPQMSQKKIKERSHKLSSQMESAAMELINNRGWATEKEIIKIIGKHIHNVSKTGFQRQIKKILGELIQKYELSRKHGNKILFESLGISEIISENGNQSFPFVIYKSKQ